MNRRALGRGRKLIALGALVTLAGLLPPWWTVARTNAPAIAGNGFDGVGIVIFLAALAMLAVITLPFALRDGISSLDRPATYVVLGLAAIGSYLFRVFEISRFAPLGLPTDAPGLYITAAGLLLVVWGVADMLTERPTTY